ncbi:methanethiol oxidase [Bradysia coprophila]|uniref:methanethiol oxidase n=1 Tax=Bradysia coprophila TaxID=38358 RepID=UPI00187D8A8C|nr:methanethiol oxidase [Bradysia coprophila]
MNRKCCGPGYATPLDAYKNGPREKLLYVVTVQPNLSESHGDYLSTVDVDPDSATYCQIIHRTFTNRTGDELHHSGWNACSSCFNITGDDATKIPKRDKLILPSLNSNNIYVFDVGTNERKPEIWKVIDGKILLDNNVSSPHSTHCLANGNVMISTMGDRNDNAKGDFILFDSQFECVGTWTKGAEKAKCGYDFWYQPKFNVMVASEWGAPKNFKQGFHPDHLANPDEIGRRLNFYKWNEQTLFQTIDLGDEGMTPLEVRFLHDPTECHGYVGCALYSNLYHFWRKEGSDRFEVEKVVDVPAKKVDGWALPEVTGLMGDIIISLDDKYLYFTSWLQGDVRQYDITDRSKPKLTGQVFLGGVVLSDSNVVVTEDKELKKQPDPVFVKGKRLQGGPQMMQLSLDGKRLYITSSLYSPWDKQFYPDMIKSGGHMVCLDVDTENGGMTLNADFFVDFSNEPYGPTVPHEMRYPGGDCTSDIWLDE